MEHGVRVHISIWTGSGSFFAQKRNSQIGKDFLH